MTNVLLSPTEAKSDLAKALHAKGARIVTWPELNTGPLESHGPLDEAIENLFGYDWIVLKNSFAAEFFLRRLRDLSREIDALDELRVCVVGESTAERLRETQVHADLPLDRFAKDGVFVAIASYLGGSESISGLNLLVPSAKITREPFEEQLESHGARVDSLPAYRTTDENQRLAQIKGLLAGGGIDWIVFAQPSAIEELAQVFDTNNLPRLLAGVSVACCDRETKNTATQFGLASAASPNDPSVNALADLIVRSLR
jgi:uroporphyrinogen III methyltransferase / synthase